MSRTLDTQVESFPIAGSFTISRGAKTSADVVTATIRDGAHLGRGECVPYRRYGETIEGVIADIAAMRGAIAEGIDRERLRQTMKPGAARNAIDCALWDLEAKMSGVRVATRLGLTALQAPITAFTLSLGEPEAMAADAAHHRDRALLKVKVGTADDRDRIRAVRRGAPDSEIILDANEGWTEDTIGAHLDVAHQAGISLIEQPLPAGKDDLLARIVRKVPICADESVHDSNDLADLAGRYDAINIKLDKTGGLTEAIAMKAKAEALGLRIMVGCMVGTSLGMAPAVLLAQGVDWVDLDGPLLLARDRTPSLTYPGSRVEPPSPELWG